MNESFALGFNDNCQPPIDNSKMWFGFLVMLILSGGGSLEEKLDSWDKMLKETKAMIDEIKKEHEHE